MADLILICRRDRSGDARERARVETVARLLTPPGVAAPRVPSVIGEDGVLAALANASGDGSGLRDGGVRVGGFIGPPGAWWGVGSPAPDGTYALVRWDAGTVEVLDDVVGSRAVWYTMDDAAFAVSTSQRALAALLGGLKLDPRAPAWLLSSGTLGPLGAWDERAKALPPDARLVLDRTTWRVTEHRRTAAFAPRGRSRRGHVDALAEAIDASCAALDLDHERWLLPLSGGLDSRVILMALRRGGARPRAVTWTTPSSLRDPLSDARVARRVARRFGVAHEFVVLDHAETGGADALDAFVAAGEGRTDEYAGYIDGLAMWGRLAEAGVDGIIRGDESCGLRKRNVSDAASRRAAGATLAADYPADHLVRRLGLAAQTLPEWLERQADESAEEYCDRADQQLYHPQVLAPLNAIKARYLEVVNPLLSRAVIETVRTLPDDLRVHGRALYAVAARGARGVPFARASSTPSADEYLAHPDVVEEIVRCLTSPAGEEVVSEAGAVALLTALAAESSARAPASTRLKGTLKSVRAFLPKRAGERLSPRYAGPDPLPAARLAFRAAIATKAIALLRADTVALGHVSR